MDFGIARRDTGGASALERPTASLMQALLDPMRPTFLFGTVYTRRLARLKHPAIPPRDGTSMEAAVDIGEKFIARSRALATDGFIVYDIQDEAGRTQDARPFPFMKTLDPAVTSGVSDWLRDTCARDKAGVG
ncbi:hypothetical protein T492DRAFT_850059 [Pavlovales sp. CCMP2436]|nr:hypothetical protein T492DRAFT_850059 [Pavlovales sp. CCMP2436]